ncbi:MAG: hypothetical protein R6X09_06365 [Bacteroidales bacterium]
MLLIDAPADSCFRNPSANRIQILVGEAEFATHRFNFKDVQNPGDPKTASLEIKDTQKRFTDTSLVSDAPVCNAEGDSSAFFFGRAEDGLDVGRIAFDVRHHHQDVFGQKTRHFFEHPEQLIPEHFHFTHRTVTGMDLVLDIRNNKICYFKSSKAE